MAEFDDNETEYTISYSSSDQDLESCESESDFEGEIDKSRATEELNAIFNILNIDSITSNECLDEKYIQLKNECKKRMTILSKRKLHYTPSLCRHCNDTLEAAKSKFKEGDKSTQYLLRCPVAIPKQKFSKHSIVANILFRSQPSFANRKVHFLTRHMFERHHIKLPMN